MAPATPTCPAGPNLTRSVLAVAMAKVLAAGRNVPTVGTVAAVGTSAVPLTVLLPVTAPVTASVLLSVAAPVTANVPPTLALPVVLSAVNA